MTSSAPLMGGGLFANSLLAALACLLCAAAVTDLRGRTIEHWTVIAIAALAPFFWWSQGFAVWPDVATQLALAAGLFAIFTGLWAIGGIGGGDVKLLGALGLCLPAPLLLTMLFVMACAGGVIALTMLAARKLRGGKHNSEVPYGLAIALGGVWAICEPHLNQFA